MFSAWIQCICTSYTTFFFSPVPGNNARALEYLPYRLANRAMTILYNPNHLARSAIFLTIVCDFWQDWYKDKY